MKVSILGVFLGGLADVTSSILLGLPITIYEASRLAPSLRGGPHASEALDAALHANVGLFVAQLLIGLLCSMLGGFVAATIAKRHERLNGTLSCFLCVVLGITTIALHFSKDPLWLQALLLLASPVCAFIGGDLKLRRRKARAAHSAA